ncbi:MAG: thioredoxin domain-containing protein [Planctomycetota bacterium]
MPRFGFATMVFTFCAFLPVVAAPPPGSIPYPSSLIERIDAAVEKLGPHYKPRTKHLHADGTAQFTNRLIFENSPYLLQHAHNPVNWYPWSDAAFETAAALDRPVLLSVGYSTCHWCHVMEEESFEDLEIAKFMNEHFICIKVDRERRPDVDNIYMAAVNAIAGRGGWPMTVAMTPDRKPFFGGTYFPARDGDRGAHRGFLGILRVLSTQYRDNQETIRRDAERLTQRISQQLRATLPAVELTGTAAITATAAVLHENFDTQYGGFSWSSNKFPQPAQYELLLRHHRRTGDAQSLHIVTHSLDKMADGGIYDHVAGGFHRYSTDRRWLVPHFEKMLYDNAQLANLYLDAYQVVHEAKAARIAREILDYVIREMTDKDGGFYSATDADSKNLEGHTEEGFFFSWTIPELKQLLSSDEYQAIVRYHGVTPRGNFEGRNLLFVPRPIGQAAALLKIEPQQLRKRLTAAYRKLYAHRNTRPKPILDDKILVSWNALMISAMARGAAVLHDSRYLRSARRAATFLTTKLRDGSHLHRVYRQGQVSHEGVLNDYAFLINALLDLFEVDHDIQWVEIALQLQSEVDAHFWDAQGKGYFFSRDSEKGLLVREKRHYDGAIPSGNSYAALNLLRLAEMTSRLDFQKRGQECLQVFGAALQRGRGVPKLASAYDFLLDRPKEIVLIKPTAASDIRPFTKALARHYLPNRTLVVMTQGDARFVSLIPWTSGKAAIDGKVTAYVCEEGVCQLPTTDPKVFIEQLQAKK